MFATTSFNPHALLLTAPLGVEQRGFEDMSVRTRSTWFGPVLTMGHAAASVCSSITSDRSGVAVGRTEHARASRGEPEVSRGLDLPWAAACERSTPTPVIVFLMPDHQYPEEPRTELMAEQQPRRADASDTADSSDAE